jgi:DNA modification methylase
MNEIILGDCLEVMKTFPDNHFSAILTDSPYGISFMGKDWDRGIPSAEYWKEMLRIVKPGGHLLAAGLPRMMHRLISVIEDSGWQIRDLLMHLFGSGFPKSHNHFGIEGYGTALKPAWEVWSLAMKPCEGTFKQNAEKWGQAGINIDGSRVKGESWGSRPRIKLTSKGKKGGGFGQTKWERLGGENKDLGKGRWPSNVILDEEAGEILGSPSRFFYCSKTSSRERNEGLEGLPDRQTIGGGGTNNTEDDVCGKYGSIKAVAKNHHPTVKPLSLMKYLITLIMPPKDGILLDPFAGSGSTILAAHQLGIKALGIEKNAEYCEIAKKRLEFAEAKSQTDQMEMEF